MESLPQTLGPPIPITEAPILITESLTPITESLTPITESPAPITESPAILETSPDQRGAHALETRINKFPLKAPTAKVEALIIEMCRINPRTAIAISLALQRRKDYVQQKYLSPMVKVGKLETLMRTKEHPKLRYIAAATAAKT